MYGESLVCVRYRYYETTRTRLKTVEIIVEKKTLPALSQQKAADNTLDPARISSGQWELGKMARAMGGKWDPDVKLWYIPHGGSRERNWKSI